MVLEFSQQMKHAQRTEKYIRLIFNSYISDGDIFKSPCALQNPKYGKHVQFRNGTKCSSQRGDSRVYIHTDLREGTKEVVCMFNLERELNRLYRC